MIVSDCGRLLSVHVSSARIAVPEKTPLYATATDILGMATAYHKDGSTFLSSGDWVNALAAFWYGYGWLHFGAMAGYFEIPPEPCPFRTPFEKAPAHLCQKLLEKSERYNHLLNSARAAVVPAPEQGTAMHSTARRVLLISAVYAGQGQRYHVQGQEENALACFSYGHGWLDAAVRAGIFSITKDRDLFTV
jgi:hypothetical protein